MTQICSLNFWLVLIVPALESVPGKPSSIPSGLLLGAPPACWYSLVKMVADALKLLWLMFKLVFLDEWTRFLLLDDLPYFCADLLAILLWDLWLHRIIFKCRFDLKIVVLEGVLGSNLVALLFAFVAVQLRFFHYALNVLLPQTALVVDDSDLIMLACAFVYCGDRARRVAKSCRRHAECRPCLSLDCAAFYQAGKSKDLDDGELEHRLFF